MTDRANLLDRLLDDPSRAADVTREEAGALAVELARVAKALELRAVRAPERPPEPPKPLTFTEVAERSGKSVRWWRDNWRRERDEAQLVVIRKGRTLLIPEDSLERWKTRECDRA